MYEGAVEPMGTLNPQANKRRHQGLILDYMEQRDVYSLKFMNKKFLKKNI